MDDYERIHKLMDYAKTLGIHIENWEMSKELSSIPACIIGRGTPFEEVCTGIDTTVQLTARIFELPKGNGFLLHIGNFNE